MPLTVSCPYCNSRVSAPPELPSNGRMICPRCDESISLDGAIEVATSTPPSNGKPTRLTNRAIAAVILAVMVGVGAFALAFAIKTQPFRRAQDSKAEVPPESDPVAASRPPHEWPGLGYLPTDCQAIAGIRMIDAAESPVGRALLSALGLSAEAVSQIRVLGLSPREIDHFVIGANLRALPPRVMAVAHDYQRIDLGRVRQGIAATKDIEHGGKPLIAGRLWSNGLEGLVWKPDQHFLVGAILPDEFDQASSAPGALQESIAGIPADRFDAKALAWLAISTEDKNPTMELLTRFLPLPPEEQKTWQQLESLAMSVREDGDKLVMTIQIRGRDVVSSDSIAHSLANSMTKAGIEPKRSSDDGWQKLVATMTTDQIAKWVSMLKAK